MKTRYLSLLIIATMLLACQTVRNGGPQSKKLADAQQFVPAHAAPEKTVLPPGVPLARIGPAYKARMFDCIENTSIPTNLRLPNPKLNFFEKRPDAALNFFLAEEGGWPFVVGHYKFDQFKSGGDYLVAMRGEASGWHKSAATAAVLSLIDNTQGKAMILLDEYSYIKKEKFAERSIMPICHRSYHKEGYLGTEIPGFKKGGANRLLRRVLPAPANIIFVSYSNATTPRGEFIPREPRPGYNPDYRVYQDPAKFLTDHILETRFVDSVYENIRGFIDIEGNFEYNKQFWDLLAFIKLEIETRPEKFFYATARIEKFDAYPGQVTMINALGLKGREGADGVIRYQNKRGNVIIDIVTNAYQPNYWNVGKDVRTATRMEVYKGKDMTRTRLSHFNIPAWAANRILKTTPFLTRRPTAVQTSMLSR